MTPRPPISPLFPYTTLFRSFHAQHISVLAGYPCYHWVLRESDDNASYEELEPVGYYQNVREVLDLIDEHMEPGPRSEEHTSELQSHVNLVCRLLLEKKKNI